MVDSKQFGILLQRNKNLRDANIRLKKRLEIARRERDAAVSDLYRARNCLTCTVNRDSKDENAPEFRLLCHPCRYEWRGLSVENGGVKENAQTTCT